MKYAVVGTGAIGGYYGAKLQQGGHRVSFLARSDYKYIQENGLLVDSCNGNFKLDKVDVYKTSSELNEIDVILLATKTTTNNNLTQILSPIVKDGTIILVLQNGLGMEDEMQKMFPYAVVLGGMCFTCSQKKGPGHIVHIDKGSISAAPLKPKDIVLLDKIKKDFVSSGVPFSVDEDLKQARWNKLLWNIPFNGLSVVLKADTKEMMSNPFGISLARKIMTEVVKGAEACSCKLDINSIEKMIEFTKIMKPYKPSMRIDYDLGRKMEVEYMYRKPLLAAAENGVELPYIAMLADQLDFLNECLD